MPFFEKPKNFNIDIDYDRYMPVAVLACYQEDGKIIPMRIKFKAPDESLITVDVDGVRSTKDILGGFSFCCLVTNYGRQQQVILNFYIKEHLWVMERTF